MFRCIQLAKNGIGNTYPNPLVGSVIVHDDRIIGEGWHKEAGLPHAEVNAIKSVREKHLLKEATIYVSLEPCSHFGKTPPCANLIVDSGINKVVIGSQDPNPKVSGSGIAFLKQAGCEVRTGVLEKACDHLNKRFLTFQNKKRPYVTLKWAQTKNGFIAPSTRLVKRAPVWISNTYSKQLAHKLRTQEEAILVGTQTVIDDNPTLNARNWAGSSPIRMIIDKDLKVSTNSNIFNKEVETIVFTEKKEALPNGISHRYTNFSNSVPTQILNELFRKNIQSLIVEGGARTLQYFIDENLWDEAMIFEGEANFEDGVLAPKISSEVISEKKIRNDILRILKNETH